MKTSDICLFLGVLAIVASSVLLVPPGFTGSAVWAHIIGSSLFGSALLFVSGIVVGWLNHRWKPISYIAAAMLVIGVLMVGLVR